MKRVHCKISILGGRSVGKSTFLAGGAKVEPSKEVSIIAKKYQLGDTPYDIEYWDCPGTRFCTDMVPAYCHGSAILLFMYRDDVPESLHEVEDLVHKMKNTIGKKFLVCNYVDSSARSQADGLKVAHANEMIFLTANVGQQVDAIESEMLSYIEKNIPISFDHVDLLGTNIQLEM